MDSLFNFLGTLFMVGLPDIHLDDGTRDLIRGGGVHNFILFKRNVHNPEQLTKLCADLQASCLEAQLPKPIISIDQEGGTVARLPPPFSQFPDQRQIAGSEDAEELLIDYARRSAIELKEVGINMNLAPVLDICKAGHGYFMERRCLGDDPDRVAHLGCLVVQEMQAGGVATCVKHFPGLGRAVLDPHLELPIVSAGQDRFLSEDILPFRKAFEVGAASCMTSHALYEGFDEQKPGTLSFSIGTELLRKKLGYTGLVITDDLEMGAIEKTASNKNAALEAFCAGADLMLICEDQEKVWQALAAFRAGANQGLFGEQEVRAALGRQNTVRQRFLF